MKVEEAEKRLCPPSFGNSSPDETITCEPGRCMWWTEIKEDEGYCDPNAVLTEAINNIFDLFLRKL